MLCVCCFSLAALFHSVFIFWLLLNIYREDVVWSNGKNGDYLVLGNAVYTCVIVTVILKAALEKSSWTWLSLLAFGGSIVIWLIFLLVYRSANQFILPFPNQYICLDIYLKDLTIFICHQ